MKTRPDIFGTRQFLPLTPSVKPLPTLPPIVGSTMYSPAIKFPGRKLIGRMEYSGETPGSQFLRTQTGRSFMSSPSGEISEPSLNNPQRR